MKNSMKRLVVIGIMTGIISILPTTGVSATWKQNSDNTWSNTNVTSGWFKDTDGNWYFFKNGIMQTGWIKDSNEKWYYLSNDGSMLSNTTTPDGYKVDNNGVWVQNTTVNNTNNTNNINNGTINNGQIVNNTNVTNNNIYINGEAKTDNNSVTKPSSTNKILSFPCWLLIDGEYYYFNKNEQLEYNTIIDGYELGNDGAWIVDDSMDKPTVTEISNSLKISARQIIEEQKRKAELEERKQDADERMFQIRKNKIEELKKKIEDLKKQNGINTQLQIGNLQKQIEELEKLNNGESVEPKTYTSTTPWIFN